MTKQDYIAIAEAIVHATHATPVSRHEICLACLSHELGLVFEADNPRFDWEWWESAIGLKVEDEVVE